MKNARIGAVISLAAALLNGPASAGIFGGQFDVNDFYLPFTAADITPENQQTWPYINHTSMNWDDYAIHGTAFIAAAGAPAPLTVAGAETRLDLTTPWDNGRSFLESLIDTQVKGFLVVQDGVILAEFYDNGFNVDQTQLLQSASKSYAGVITAMLAEEGILDRNATVASYLEDFANTSQGRATVQQVMDMASGLDQVLDFHTPGAEGYLFEIEQGMKAGEPQGHRNLVREAEATFEPGKVWAYNDKNTDTLMMLAERVTGRSFVELLSDLFSEFGANAPGSIALTSDGTAAPSYGLSTTLRDYGLFHQWIAQGKAPAGYYVSLRDTEKDLMLKSKSQSLYDQSIQYGDQAYFLPEHDIVMSMGSFGQYGFSDLKTGTAVVFMQDWATNGELDKANMTHARAVAVLTYLRQIADPASYRKPRK